MDLRPELQFPSLDESKVQRLAALADRIDGSSPDECEDELEQFNHLASTSREWAEFQGVYGGMDHDTWVRNVLCMPFADKQLELSHDEMLEIITRLCTAAGEEHERFFWIRLLETNLDPRISDLIYWPGEYFGDGNNSREMSPLEILEIAMKAKI